MNCISLTGEVPTTHTGKSKRSFLSEATLLTIAFAAFAPKLIYKIPSEFIVSLVPLSKSVFDLGRG
jgi:hypothetical protein